jgi:hypothetical protein
MTAERSRRIVNRSTEPNTQKIRLAEKLASFNEQWSPKVVGELNGQHVKLVKFQGEFVWHHHDLEDELFSWCAARSAWIIEMNWVANGLSK